MKSYHPSPNSPSPKRKTAHIGRSSHGKCTTHEYRHSSLSLARSSHCILLDIDMGSRRILRELAWLIP